MSNVATNTTARLVETIKTIQRHAEFYDDAVESAHEAGLDTISEEMSERSIEWHDLADQHLATLADRLGMSMNETIDFFLSAAYGIGK